MMSIGTLLHTVLKGKRVGEDMFGNVYYTERKPAKKGRTKRWVMYKGKAEPSKIPPLWHAWMHYMVDELPADIDVAQHDWQKEHQPNLTGTVNAYQPPGHLAGDAKRDTSSSDYEAWTP